MKKYIKILLSLPVEEFINESNELETFIGTLNNIYIKRDIFFELKRCGDLSNVLETERWQEEDYANIRDCQFFYLLFGKNAGKHAEEEFNIALKQFQENGAPKIYTYFKQLPQGESAEKSVLDFMERLSEQLGHYYSSFTHLDAIKLNFMLELTQDEQFNSVVEFQDGQAFLDKQPVLSLNNVPLYRGNETLQQKLERKKQLDEEFGVLVSEYNQNSSKTEAMNKMGELASERKRIQDEIHKIEMDMLNMCRKNATKRHLGTALNWREKRAMELVDQGDYVGAKIILRDPQWDEEVRQNEEELELIREIEYEKREKIREYISGKRNLIFQLRATGLNRESVKEITDIYENITAKAEKHQMELGVLCEYANFMLDQNQFKKGIAIAEKLRKYYEQDINVSDKDKWELLDVLGVLYREDGNFSEAKCVLEEALQVICCLSEKKKGIYESDVAVANCNLADLLRDIDQKVKAEELYNKALQIYYSLSENNPKAYEFAMAHVDNNLAGILLEMGRKKEAEDLWRDALKIRRRLPKKNPETYEVSVANSCYNLAYLLAETNQEKEAEELFYEALTTYRSLAEKNPEAHEEMLVRICNNLGDFLLKKNRRNWHKAEKLFQESLEILCRLYEKNPKAHEHDVVVTCNNLAFILLRTKRKKQADALQRRISKLRSSKNQGKNNDTEILG